MPQYKESRLMTAFYIFCRLCLQHNYYNFVTLCENLLIVIFTHLKRAFQWNIII